MDEHAPGIGEVWLEQMPVDALQGATRNPKGHADDQLQASMTAFGYVEPVLYDERTGRLVAGHGRVENVRRLQSAGGDPPDGITVDEHGRWCIPVRRGWASNSDQEAEAYLVGSNRLTELGGWEDSELAAAMREVYASDPTLMDVIGFDEARTAELLGDEDLDGDPLSDVDPELEEEPYRQQYGLLIPCRDTDEAEMIALVMQEQGYHAKAIQA